MCKILAKYRLSKLDAKRFQQLAAKEATGLVTTSERRELDKLDELRHKLFWSQPKMQALKRREAYLLKRTDVLLKKAKALCRRIKRTRCSSD